jgi:alpha-L-fucosidase
MKRTILIVAVIMAFASGIILTKCDFKTAYGPTPYSIFEGVTSSTASLTIDSGTQNLIVPPSLPLPSGQKIFIKYSVVDSILMEGTITSYNRSTGALVVQVTRVNGSGTYSNWIVTLGLTAQQILDSLQKAYLDMKFGMFVHFNMSTFNRCCCAECISTAGEWGVAASATVTPDLFHPGNLNCGQWADIAKSAGCKYMILTSKHHDGFCLWDSKLTQYSVAHSSWRGGKGDVIKEFADSARARGLKVGLYYSIRDFTNGYSLSFVKGQLAELLTNYGEITVLWFDGWGWGPGYIKVPYDTVRNLIKSIQPHCLILENNHYYKLQYTELVGYEMPVDGAPKVDNILPAEGCNVVHAGSDYCWFWHPSDECLLKSPQTVVDQLNSNNSRNANYLFDLTPDTTGLIPQCQVDLMKQVGQLRGVSQ